MNTTYLAEPQLGLSVTVFIAIDDHSFFPAKQEVAEPRPQHHREAKPDVIRHHNQHEKITNSHLYYVKECLKKMYPRAHPYTANKKRETKSTFCKGLCCIVCACHFKVIRGLEKKGLLNTTLHQAFYW